jgi:predicted dehydrogenase
MSGLGVGLVGAGRFATFITEATADLPGLAWRGVADPDTAAVRHLAARLGVPASDGWRQLLGDPAVEALVVASPPATHAEIVRTALESGRHVFCEKPLATSAAEARELAALADQHQRVLVVTTSGSDAR